MHGALKKDTWSTPSRYLKGKSLTKSYSLPLLIHDIGVTTGGRHEVGNTFIKQAH
ncbi:unnamed protein product, partial [Chrysoparadoxa australica]